MDRDKTFAWVTAERLSVAEFLSDLTEEEWKVPSLCAGWTVRDVAAHLTLSTRHSLWGTLRGVIRARGNWERAEAVAARERATQFEPAELIAQLRETADSKRLAPGASPMDPLTDALVHGQDIARPLGREHDLPSEQAAAAATHVCRSAFYGARKRLRGTTLIATDIDWTFGTGPDEARGAVAALLLVATGRPAALPELTGPGVDRLTAAL